MEKFDIALENQKKCQYEVVPYTDLIQTNWKDDTFLHREFNVFLSWERLTSLTGRY